MADAVVHETGLISVDNGSPGISGYGTAFIPACEPGDSIFIDTGSATYSAVIDTVSQPSGQDAMTMLFAWRGPSLSHVPFKVVRGPFHGDPVKAGPKLSEFLAQSKLSQDALTAAQSAVATVVVQTGQDKAATAADRVQTGQDRTATGQDRTATAADRVQTGQDRTATGQDKTNADASATLAQKWATQTSGEVAGPGSGYGAKKYALDAAASAGSIDTTNFLNFQNLTETDVPSAATVDLGAVASSRVRITGTTAITSFGTGVKKYRLLRFAAALVLTNGAALALPGGANITTAVNDTALAVSDASGNWRIVNYQRADGTPLAYNFGTAAGTVAQGNDSRITGAAQKSANGSDFANLTTLRANIGLGFRELLNTSVTTAAAVVVVTVPNDVNQLWMVGEIMNDIQAFNLYQISQDNQASWLSLAGTHYANGYMYQTGTSLSGSNSDAISGFRLTPPNDTAVQASFFGKLFVGSASLRSKHSAVGTGLVGSNISSIVSEGYSIGGRVTHIRFIASAGNLAVGTILSVEGR